MHRCNQCHPIVAKKRRATDSHLTASPKSISPKSAFQSKAIIKTHAEIATEVSRKHVGGSLSSNLIFLQGLQSSPSPILTRHLHSQQHELFDFEFCLVVSNIYNSHSLIYILQQFGVKVLKM